MNESPLPTNTEIMLFCDGKCLDAIDAYRARVGQISNNATEDIRNHLLANSHPTEWPYMGDVLTSREVDLAKANNLIGAIKEFRARTGKGLKASKDIVEAAVPASERAPRLGWEDMQELRKGNLVAAIKSLRTRHPKLSLQEAKKLCDDSGLLPKAEPIRYTILPSNTSVSVPETFDASQFNSQEYTWGGSDMKHKMLCLLEQEKKAMGGKYTQLSAMLAHLIKRVEKL